MFRPTKKVFEFDRVSSKTFSKNFLGDEYKTDFTTIDAVVDTIIKSEDRVWLFNKLGIASCLDQKGFCTISSWQIPAIMNTLHELKDDPVLAYCFPDLISALRERNYIPMVNALQSIQVNGVNEYSLPPLTIGAFNRFGWSGDYLQIPITRRLAEMKLPTLESTYLELLRYRPLLRYIDNENDL